MKAFGDRGRVADSIWEDHTGGTAQEVTVGWSKLLCLVGEVLTGAGTCGTVDREHAGSLRQRAPATWPLRPLVFFYLLVDLILSCAIHLFTQQTCVQSIRLSHSLPVEPRCRFFS